MARRNYARESFQHGAEALRKRRAAGFPDEPHLWPQFKVLDEDDAESRAVMWPQHSIIAVGPDGGGSVAAYNRGLWCSSGDVVVHVMDDIQPPPHWDALIAARIGDPTRPRLLHVSDGTKLHGDRTIPLLTVLIGTMALFKRAGYMYHPDYLHCFGDDDWSEKGHKESIVEEATDIVFRFREFI